MSSSVRYAEGQEKAKSTGGSEGAAGSGRIQEGHRPTRQEPACLTSSPPPGPRTAPP